MKYLVFWGRKQEANKQVIKIVLTFLIEGILGLINEGMGKGPLFLSLPEPDSPSYQGEDGTKSKLKKAHQK